MRLLTPLGRDHEAAELMDGPASSEELARCFDAIARLNRLFGGSSLTLRHVRDIMAAVPADRLVTVLDVGAGAGDVPVALVGWARTVGRRIRVLALDRDSGALGYARAHVAGYPEISLLRGDALALPLRQGSVDVVISALTLHHLPPEEAVRYLAEIDAAARLGWVVNDLVRGRVAHVLVWLLTRLVTRSRMARQDGPTSVLRAYTPSEIAVLCEKAGLLDVRVVHHAPFLRQCAIRIKR